MRILYVYPFCGLGGVETSIINKINALQNIGIDSQALLLNFWGDGGKLLMNNSHITAVPTLTDIVSTLNTNFDIISIIDFPEFLNLLDRLKISSKIIYETHCSDLNSMNKNYKIINHEKISAVIVPSAFNKKMITSLIKTDKEIFILPNPINMNLFTNIPTSKLSRGYEKYINKTNIIWVGRLEAAKNPVEFIELGLMLLKTNRLLHFTLVGDICNDYDFFNFTKSYIPLNNAANFSFLHSIPNEKMPEIYSLAANTSGCLVSTSNNESSPMTFLEAISCLCPVVSTKVGGIEELIINSETGKTYNLNDISEGSKAIDALINEKYKDARDRIIDNAYSMVKSDHSLEQVSQKYKRIIDIVLSE
jgi:glycosyltransferase involved in cell wall biosynthesis